MAGKTSILGFSVSLQLSRGSTNGSWSARGTTKSDLFRRMMNAYKAEREKEAFVALQRKMARCVRKTGVLTERGIERIVFEDR